MLALKKSVLASQAFKECVSFGIEVTNKSQQLQIKIRQKKLLPKLHADSVAELPPFKRQKPEGIQ